MVLLAAIGDINRFAKDRLLVGYAGLGTEVHDSGETHRQGHITKRGRRELRTTMVEAAWSAVRWHLFWKAEFKRLVEVKHLNRKVATIAIARRHPRNGWLVELQPSFRMSGWPMSSSFAS